jgi:hypothetical protein
MDTSKLMAMRGGAYSVSALVGMFVFWVELLLSFRIFLKFFFTTADSGFVHWAFQTTDVLLSPFRGVFVNPTVAPTNWYVDFPALFAMASYAVLAALMVAMAASWRNAVIGKRK